VETLTTLHKDSNRFLHTDSNQLTAYKILIIAYTIQYAHITPCASSEGATLLISCRPSNHYVLMGHLSGRGRARGGGKFHVKS